MKDRQGYVNTKTLEINPNLVSGEEREIFFSVVK